MRLNGELHLSRVTDCLMTKACACGPEELLQLRDLVCQLPTGQLGELFRIVLSGFCVGCTLLPE